MQTMQTGQAATIDAPLANILKTLATERTLRVQLRISWIYCAELVLVKLNCSTRILRYFQSFISMVEGQDDEVGRLLHHHRQVHRGQYLHLQGHRDLLHRQVHLGRHRQLGCHVAV